MKPALLLLALLGAVASPAALACTCAPPRPVDEAVAKSSRVFAGTVTSITSSDGYTQQVTFQVSEHFKGRAAGTLVVENHAFGPMCGYPFAENVEYIVYAEGNDGTLRTSSCTRTTVATDAELDALRAL